MRIIVTSDLHFDDNPRDAYRFKFMDWLIESIHEHQVDCLLLLGDLTQSKDNHGAWLVNKFSDWMRKLGDACDVYVLKGNHDYVSEDVPFFKFFNHLSHVAWINSPSNISLGEFQCLFLPHTNNYKKDWEKFLGKHYAFIFAHQTFEGANVGPRKLEGIPLSIFKKNQRIISGDIHVPQDIGNLTYVGAPYTVNFGDDYQGRVLLISSPDKIESIEYHGAQKRLIEINSFRSSADIIERAKLKKGDLLKLRIKVKPDQYDRWEAIRSDIRDWSAKHGYSVEIIQPVMEMQPRTVIHQQDAQSDEAYVQAFAARADIPKETLSVGLNLLK